MISRIQPYSPRCAPAVETKGFGHELGQNSDARQGRRWHLSHLRRVVQVALVRVQAGVTGQGRRLLRRSTDVRQRLRAGPPPAVEVDRSGERVFEQFSLAGREVPVLGLREAARLWIPWRHFITEQVGYGLARPGAQPLPRAPRDRTIYALCSRESLREPSQRSAFDGLPAWMSRCNRARFASSCLYLAACYHASVFSPLTAPAGLA